MGVCVTKQHIHTNKDQSSMCSSAPTQLPRERERERERERAWMLYYWEIVLEIPKKRSWQIV